MVAVEFYSPVKPFELVDKPCLNQVNGAKVNARARLSTAEGATDDLARRGRITTMKLGILQARMAECVLQQPLVRR
jgi:hypothetical protein